MYLHAINALQKKSFILISILFLMSGITHGQFTDTKSTRFSIQELETLGATTIQDSIEILKSQTNQSISSTSSNYTLLVNNGNQNGLSLTESESLLNTLTLQDLDYIEVSKDNAKITYHLAKSIQKDNITALVSFTLIETEKLPTLADPIITSVTKSPTEESNLGDTIQVISNKQIQQLGATNVEDILSLVGNLSIANASGIKSIFMRGQHSGAVTVLYNGINLKDVSGTNGAPLFELIPVEDIERIEIISGSQSTLYGSGAMAGVINIIPKQAKKNGYIHSNISSDEYYTTVKASNTLAHTTFNFIGTQQRNASLSAQSSDSETDTLNQESAQLRFSNNNSSKHKVNGTLSVINRNQDLDGWNDEIDFDSQLANISYQYQRADKKTTSYIQADVANTNRKYFTNDVEQSNYDGRFVQIDVANEWKSDKNKTWLLGFNHQEEEGESTWLSKSSQSNIALYGQYRQTHSFLSSQLGARIESPSIDTVKSIQTYHLSFFRTVPFINTKATYTLKTGYRVPTLYEQQYKGNTATTDPSVTPERSKTHEISLFKKFQNIQLKTSYFNNICTDKITYDGSFQHYTNIDQSTQSGFESSIQLFNIKALDFLTLSYTTVHAKDDNELALRVPKNKATLSTGITKNKLSTGLFWIYEGKRNDVIWNESWEQETITLKAFNYIDITAQYNLTHQTQLFSKIHNIFNTDYETVSGYNEPGRSIFIGFKQYF